jgi:molecular chaperone DnaK (HSP70)
MAFNDRKVVILGAAHDASVGGLFFDDCVRDFFHKHFLAKFNIDAKKNPKAWQRLLDESEKLRKQMSANSTAIPLAIECFMDNIDVSGKMNRYLFS